MEPAVDNKPPQEGQADASSNRDDAQNEDRNRVEDKPNVVEVDATHGPMKVLKPLRTDAVHALQSRQRRLERLAAVAMPELHYVGQIVSGKGIVLDGTEGACCRWKVDHGKAWEHLGGEVFGQTQIAYSRNGIISDDSTAFMVFNHPLDLHFAAAGLQGWGAPRITVQCYRMDWHGRRLLSGYGFAHLPTTPGPHRIEVSLWRPVGSAEQEMEAHLLGSTPALTNHAPIYESAWRERCRLVTISAGKIFIDFFVITRNLKTQGVDIK